VNHLKRTDLEAVKKMVAEKKFREAIEALVAIESGGEATAESQYLLGTVYHRVNHLAEAVNAFKRSLLLDPQFTDSAISLSVIYNDTGHYKEAQEVFERAEKNLQENQGSASHSVILDRELAERHIELGNLYRKLQRFDAAAHEYMKAVRLDPRNLQSRINLAKTLAQRGQTKLAQRELENLIAEHPRHVAARVHLALLLYSMGNAVDARMELSQALLYDPQNKQVRMYLAMTEKATESTMPAGEAEVADRRATRERSPEMSPF
jgi:tetratricopeptide (TPR) repeat protein